ncbi:MAG: uroporphyrinogen-III C-methyltransferase [Sulfuricurvum sp.]|jgi:uroporphyrin-III C-methyltransferase|uniref:uroporphyrinogen-III C-methyltransferase n=1 Tax=Sulfuricurvum sp. TaxID=2025608 RepID=UPI0025DB91B3|nr:uroporphyrinogen-III C-methyltransferase [Sulfuricurvum sp.]MCK9372326.1 uroporphyrinogen-III C-methyltransferase [Sulfuricurvum sp.]
MSGKVFLTGAGPGDPDLLTVKALRLIREADVILYDRLVNETILNEAKAGVTLVYVGKEDGHHTIPQEKINALLYEHAQNHSTVVRLKGGDPLIFGRGGEEALYLAERGIAFEFVPGISSAIAVPTYAGIPVTQRGINTSFRVLTGHHAKQNPETVFDPGILRENETLVILMGVKGIGPIVEALIRNGVDLSVPCAVIENGTMPEQKCTVATVGTIVEASKGAGSPAIIVVGQTVGLSEQLKWFV